MTDAKDHDAHAVTKVTPPGRVVALTGADGFLGRNLIGLLEDDDRVSRIVALDVERPATAGRKTRFYKVDLTQPRVETHPLRGHSESRFLRDKIEAEQVVASFARSSPETLVTVLRLAPILGPTVKNYLTRYLGRSMVPTVMGFDPLMQFLHEVDALAAFKLAVMRDIPGVFNIVGDGVLPLSTVIQLTGRIGLPIPHPVMYPIVSALWTAQLSEAPPTFVDYARWLCVADGDKALRELKFRPAFTTREAVLDYAYSQQMRDAHLLRTTP